MKYNIKEDINGNKYVEVKEKGYNLLNNPLLNKGNSFSHEEKTELDLHGLVTSSDFTLEQRRTKIHDVINAKPSDLERHIFLRGLQDRNEIMFYSIVNNYIKEMLPIIYTPVVGEACQKFSEIYRKPRGLFISYPDKDIMDKMLQSDFFDGTEVIVVTDGERILGLGDQGVGGMGIPIGKLSLYTAIAGIAPHKTLPIVLDVGTDNEELLSDPEYIGWHHKRVRGQDYDDFIECFVQAVKKRFPNVLLQFEDFAQQNALRLLDKYKDELCCFNDDIQGTASVVVGALLSAIKASGVDFAEHKIVVCGAGSAGVGISNLIVDCFVEHKVARDHAVGQIFLVDRYGLITQNVESKDFQKPFIKDATGWNVSNPNNINLLETVVNTQATILIGVSGQSGIFSQQVVEQMAKNTRHPIVFPISNPTSKAEATPADVLKWTNGAALVGTGSPFPDINRNGKLMRVDQVNNSYVFPAMGLGILALKAKRVTPRMFLIASIALAECSPVKSDVSANILPDLEDIHAVAKHIANAVAKEIVKLNLSGYGSNISDDKVKQLIDEYYWTPEYLPLKYSH